MVAQKVARLKTIVAERAAWEKSLAQVKRMHQWVPPDCFDGNHRGTKELHTEHVQSLTAYVFGTHVDDTFHAELGTDCCSCHTMLVTLVNGWSYMEADFSALRLRGSCGPTALPLAFSSEPEELSMACDHVNEFSR